MSSHYDKFEQDPESHELNFGTDIELPSGRKLCTGAFDSVNIIESPTHGNPLPVIVQIKNNKMVHVTHHRNMEEAELAIVAMAYFCDSVLYFRDLEEEVAEQESGV